MITPHEILINTYDKSNKLVQKIIKSNDERIIYSVPNGQYKDTFGCSFDLKAKEINRNPDRLKTKGGHWDKYLNKFVFNKTKEYTPLTKEQKIAKLQAKIAMLLAN